jgi:hypothetical protein
VCTRSAILSIIIIIIIIKIQLNDLEKYFFPRTEKLLCSILGQLIWNDGIG